MVEITDAEAKILGGAKATLDRLLGNPKTKRSAERLIKEVFPDTVITDDVVEPYMAEFKDLKKKVESFMEAQQGQKLDDKLNHDIEYLMKERDFTADGIQKLKENMLKAGNPDIIREADHWDRQNPPKAQPPSIMAPSDWGFGRKTDDADLKLLFEDEDAWAEKEAGKAWAEEAAKRGQIIT